jgi:chromosome segregation ATPase
VEGLQVVAEVRAMLERTQNLLGLQETATEAHVARITGVEWRIKAAKDQLEALAKNVAGSSADRERMLAEYARILERFAVLDRALVDRPALLAGATEAVSKLMELAEQSGRLNERQLAEQMVEEMKRVARNFQDVSDRMDDAKLRIGLEHTLVQGMGTRLPNLSKEVERLLQEQAGLAAQVTGFRTAVGKLEQGVRGDRSLLDGKRAEFGRVVENYRVVQVDVLRRWLLSGPPEGDWPALSALDMMEAGARSAAIDANAPGAFAGGAAPSANSVMAEPHGMSLRGGRAGGIANLDDDMQRSNPELVKQYKRVRWYLTMIGRLMELTNESVINSELWIQQSREWNSQHMAHNRELAQLLGNLAGLAAELKTTGMTIDLTAKQAATVSAKVAEAAGQLDKQNLNLTKLTTQLRELAK